MMKYTIIGLFLMFGFSVFSASAEVLENQKTPKAKNAGRQAELTELLRITDEEGDFYFKHPDRLRVGPDGSIFVIDDKQFLKFANNGDFIANLKKQGEGPGEYTWASDYQVMEDHIIVIAAQPSKVLKLDLTGKLLMEKRFKKGMEIRQVIGISGEKFYYFRTVIDWGKVKGGIRDFPQVLHVSTFDDNITDLKADFSIQRYFHKQSSDKGMRLWMEDISRLNFAFHNEHAVYISHTEDYLIKQVDAATGKEIRRFSRKYQPVKFYARPRPPRKKGQPKPVYEPYKPDNFTDIMALALYKENILVFTSTLDKEKGILVDMFSPEGKFLDNFYIKLPGLERPDTIAKTSFCTSGDFLYIIEKDEDDLYSIAKYKLEI